MEYWKNIYNKYKEIILYLLFGGLTTLVNFATYAALAHLLPWPTVLSTAVAWFLSVLFAYITNKIWVFESRTNTLRALLRETLAFFACRVFSGVLDLLIMWVCVDLLFLNDLVIKILSNVLVVILNYLFSKLWIFKKQS